MQVKKRSFLSLLGIRLKFEGRAHVHWTETRTTSTGKTTTTHTVHYSAHEEYFKQDVLLFGICEWFEF